MRDKILRSWRGIPDRNLANYIMRNEVTLSDLVAAGLPSTKVASIQELLSEGDETAWSSAQRANSPSSYNVYISTYPEGLHINEAKVALHRLDETAWSEVQNHLCEQSLNSYMSNFPNGTHVNECRQLLDDLPWLQTKQRNTIHDYEDYMQMFPGRHDEEALNAINDQKDGNDWNSACSTGTTKAYQWYLNSHKNGKHCREAMNRIQANAGKDSFLAELRSDPNYYQATIIQEKVNNNVATWNDISGVFGNEKAEAIRLFQNPSELPVKRPPVSLLGGTTEVYFWGTPSSGKTCALGAILSSAQKKGIYEKLDCSGYDYMTRLSNIFDDRGFCLLPLSTDDKVIHEMMLKLTDSHGKKHTMTLIDLAGELFRTVYFKRHDYLIDDVRNETLNYALSYLRDRRNNKIHFFVIEYGAHLRPFDGLRMVDYLDDMIGYLKSENILRKQTVGVYVLVTKCDKINCPPEDRPRMAYEYVQQEFLSFWNNLQDACKKAGVKDLRVLSFSVGDVFAQNLCAFDGKDTDKVIDKLLTKTRPERNYDWLKG